MSKILVFGEVYSAKSYNDAINKANALHSKNNFDMLILFGSDYNSIFKTDTLTTPRLSTYLLLNSVNRNKDSKKYIYEDGDSNKEADQVQSKQMFDGVLTIFDSPYGIFKTKTASDNQVVIAWFGPNGNMHQQQSQKDSESTVQSALDLFKKTTGSNVQQTQAIDILLTRQYPANITNGVAEMPETDQLKPYINWCRDTSTVTKSVLPRYHFTSFSNDAFNLKSPPLKPSAFWERPPYCTVSPQDVDETDKTSIRYFVSRFISLAPFATKVGDPEDSTDEPMLPDKKLARFHYSFVLKPQSSKFGSTLKELSPSSTITPTTTLEALGFTDNPFLMTTKKRHNDADGDQDGARTKNRRQVSKRLTVAQEQCFLCLSNDKVVDVHLIASIGDNSYLALARGPLVLPAGRHVMIVPLTHTPTLDRISDPSDRKNTIAEFAKYKQALLKTYFLAEKDPQFKSSLVVFFEIYKSSNVHSHTQVVALSSGQADKLVSMFKDLAADRGYPPILSIAATKEDLESSSSTTTKPDHLKIEIYSDLSTSTCLSMDIPDPSQQNKRQQRFDLQFPRKVLASFVAANNNSSSEFDPIDRQFWKNCVQPKDQEQAETEKFKAAFEKYDFN